MRVTIKITTVSQTQTLTPALCGLAAITYAISANMPMHTHPTITLSLNLIRLEHMAPDSETMPFCGHWRGCVDHFAIDAARARRI